MSFYEVRNGVPVGKVLSISLMNHLMYYFGFCFLWHSSSLNSFTVSCACVQASELLTVALFDCTFLLDEFYSWMLCKHRKVIILYFVTNLKGRSYMNWDSFVHFFPYIYLMAFTLTLLKTRVFINQGLGSVDNYLKPLGFLHYFIQSILSE